MSKQANKTVIGAFVVGAIALIVIALLVFGSGKFLSKRVEYVLFFEGSVKGLQVGSPVTFRGVKIGEVTDIRLTFDPKTLTVLIPVYIEVDPAKFESTAKREGYHELYASLIAKGLKARLEVQSMVTGQLMVSADFYPEKPIKLVGLEKKYPEIPTIPSSMQELTKTIQDLPLKDIAKSLDNVLAGVNKFVSSPELHESIASLNRALKDISTLAKNMNTGEIASDVKGALRSSTLMMEQAAKAMEGVKVITVQNANLGYEINRSVEQMTALSRSLRSLADYLDRHPEALVRGKSSSKGE